MSACIHILKHKHSYILHSDLNSSAVLPTMMIGSGVALAARGLCVHCLRLRSGSVEVRRLECIQSSLEEGTGLSDKTKTQLKEQICQIELQQKAEEANCPVRPSFAQIAEARQKQEKDRRAQEQAEKRATEAKRKCISICPHELRHIMTVGKTILYTQALAWESVDFFNAMPLGLKSWIKMKARLRKPREESSDRESSDGRSGSPRRCFRKNRLESQRESRIIWTHLHVSFHWEDLFALMASMTQKYRRHYCGVSRYVVRRLHGSKRMPGHLQKGYESMYLLAFSASGVGGIEESCIQSLRTNNTVAMRCQNVHRGGGGGGGGGFNCLSAGFVYIAVAGRTDGR